MGKFIYKHNLNHISNIEFLLIRKITNTSNAEKNAPIRSVANMGSRERRTVLPLTNGEKAFKKDTVKWKITKTKC